MATETTVVTAQVEIPENLGIKLLPVATDLTCDRCGPAATAIYEVPIIYYSRPAGKLINGELLFCANHTRRHLPALIKRTLVNA
jgi:hypothetical protein